MSYMITNKARKCFTDVLNINIRVFSTKRRKYPLDPQHADNLPIFDYSISKSNYNRVFVWGSTVTGALGLPFKTKELNKKEYIMSPRRLPLAEQHEITTIACGYGFTVFGVNSETNIKVYGTGINTDSQLGYHEIATDKPLGVLCYPLPIYLPFINPVKTKIRRISAGRAHLAILTDEGLFLLGNNAYGQCGRTIIPDEQYMGSKFIHHIKDIEGKTIINVECGQDHSLVLMEDGSVYSCGWSADGQTGLGHFNSVAQFTRIKGDIASERIVKIACKSDFVLALNDKGEAFGWGNTEYAQLTTKHGTQQICNPTYIKMCKPLGKLKDVAAGGSFCGVVNEEGCVFVWGYGILGSGPAVESSKIPIQIPSTLFGVNDFQPDTCVEKITCGTSHFCVITNKGDLYSWGRNRNHCLGLRSSKDQYFPLRVSLGGLVKQVSCSVDHTVALCKPFI